MAATVSFSRLFGSYVLLWIREASLGLVPFSRGRRTAERPLVLGLATSAFTSAASDEAAASQKPTE